MSIRIIEKNKIAGKWTKFNESQNILFFLRSAVVVVYSCIYRPLAENKYQLMVYNIYVRGKIFAREQWRCWTFLKVF